METSCMRLKFKKKKSFKKRKEKKPEQQASSKLQQKRNFFLPCLTQVNPCTKNGPFQIPAFKVPLLANANIHTNQILHSQTVHPMGLEVTRLQWSCVRNHLNLTRGRTVTAQSHLQETAVMTVKENRIPHLHPEDSPQVRSEVKWAEYNPCAVPFIYFRFGGTLPWASRGETNGALATPARGLLSAPHTDYLQPIIQILTKRAPPHIILVYSPLSTLQHQNRPFMYLCTPFMSGSPTARSHS